jgi:hypothetical protein
MKTQPTIEKKYADWKSAFNSISDWKSDDANILGMLITGIEEKMLTVGAVK